MNKLIISGLLTGSLAAISGAQIPDLLNSLDAGGRSLGAGGAFGVTGADTFSILNNPAGLGYVSSRTYGLAYRNMPTTFTSLSGNLSSPFTSTNDDGSKNQLSHLGYAIPLKGGRTLGISYQVGGYISDFRGGVGMTSGTLTNVTYSEQLNVKTDFYTVAIGKGKEDGSSSIGYGLTFANVNFLNRQLGFIPGGATLIDTDNKATAYGVGLVAGIQKNSEAGSYGISLRTPIKLTGSDVVKSAYDTVPGQLSLGLARRTDSFRGSNNYLLQGAQVTHYFGGSGNGLTTRSNQTAFGLGAELGISRETFTLPIRVGYSFSPAGGDAFARRDGLTFGVGYRPNSQPWAIDLNYAFPKTGGKDIAFMFSYRFDK
jgi:hypothetical protein